MISNKGAIMRRRKKYTYKGGKLGIRTKTLADFFGVTSKTIIFWGKQGMKKLSYGLWNPEDVFNWLTFKGQNLKRQQDRNIYRYRATKIRLSLNYYLDIK